MGNKMTPDARFTPEEWTALLGGVFMAGFAVTAAQPSGLFRMLREGLASRRALAEASKNAGTNGLIKAVASALRSRIGRKITNEFAGARFKGAAQEDLKLLAIQSVGHSAAIVDRRAPADAQAFKEWLLHIATRVARASKEGSFIGFGGVVIGDTEAATLEEIAAALGLRG
jgi:hypothetical protein